MKAMQRIEGTPAHRALLVGSSLLVVLAMFPSAASEKTLTLVAYIGFSGLLLLFAATCFRRLNKCGKWTKFPTKFPTKFGLSP